MCDNEVMGCQVAPWRWVNAHATPSRLSPAETTGFWTTYSGSSQLTKSWWTTCAYTAMVAAARIVPSQRAAPTRSPPAGARHPHVGRELRGWPVEGLADVLVAQPVDEDRVADVVVRLAPAEEGAQSRKAQLLEEQELVAQEVARQLLPLGLVVRAGDASQVRQGVLVVLLVRHRPRARHQGVDRLEHGGAHGVDPARQRIPLVLPPGVEEPRQSLGPDVVVVRVARAEVGQVHGCAGRDVPLEPAREPGKVLAPVERAVDQMPVALPRAARELVEVGEVVRPGGDRLHDAREHRRPDQQAGGTAAGLEPVREPAGQDEHGGVRRQQVAVADVE